MNRILITGGTGLAGYALQKIYPDGIYLCSRDYDLTKEDDVKAMFNKYKPERVIHMAARVGGIIDNMKRQAEYFDQNILMNSFVVHYAHKYNVKKLIALVSNCAYPDLVAKYPMTEEELHAGPPSISNFAYGYAKRMLEVQIKAYRMQYGCDHFTVIPCSVYGPNEKFDEEKGHFIASLIRKIYQARQRGQKTVKLLGTGRAVRQYLYSEDLAKILLVLMDRYDGEGPINIGSPENLSIRKVAETVLEATGNSDLKLEFDNLASSDGQLRKDISSQRLFGIIGDFKFTPLEEGVKKTYEWFLVNNKDL